MKSFSEISLEDFMLLFDKELENITEFIFDETDKSIFYSRIKELYSKIFTEYTDKTISLNLEKLKLKLKFEFRKIINQRLIYKSLKELGLITTENMDKQYSNIIKKHVNDIGKIISKATMKLIIDESLMFASIREAIFPDNTYKKYLSNKENYFNETLESDVHLDENEKQDLVCEVISKAKNAFLNSVISKHSNSATNISNYTASKTDIEKFFNSNEYLKKYKTMLEINAVKILEHKNFINHGKKSIIEFAQKTFNNKNKSEQLKETNAIIQKKTEKLIADKHSMFNFVREIIFPNNICDKYLFDIENYANKLLGRNVHLNEEEKQQIISEVTSYATNMFLKDVISKNSSNSANKNFKASKEDVKVFFDLLDLKKKILGRFKKSLEVKALVILEYKNYKKNSVLGVALDLEYKKQSKNNSNTRDKKHESENIIFREIEEKSPIIETEEKHRISEIEEKFPIEEIEENSPYEENMEHEEHLPRIK